MAKVELEAGAPVPAPNSAAELPATTAGEQPLATPKRRPPPAPPRLKATGSGKQQAVEPDEAGGSWHEGLAAAFGIGAIEAAVVQMIRLITAQGLKFGDADHVSATNAALALAHALAPRDAIEGMIGAQMIATHGAMMECLRRAHAPDQGLEARMRNLDQAGKLSRSFLGLLDALNRHRGKGGQQKVTVEHVHVHQGGQAVVGTVVPTRGEGCASNRRTSPGALLT